MIINQFGETYKYNQKTTFTIGETIIVTDEEDEFYNLIGQIKEILTDEDREMGNGEDEIICDLYPPESKEAISKLEKNFSDIYQKPMKLEDIYLESIYFTPDTIAAYNVALESSHNDLFQKTKDF